MSPFPECSLPSSAGKEKGDSTLLLPLWSVPPEVASSDQWNVRLRAALSSSVKRKQTETAGVTFASDVAAQGQSSLWAHEELRLCPFNLVFAIHEAIGSIYGALLGSCSVSSWLKPSPRGAGGGLIGTEEERKLRPDKQVWLLKMPLFVSS